MQADGTEKGYNYVSVPPQVLAGYPAVIKPSLYCAPLQIPSGATGGSLCCVCVPDSRSVQSEGLGFPL